MYKITNIDTLGTEYTVANQEGKVIKNIRIIQDTEILDAAGGEYTFENSLEEYMTKAVSLLEGNEDMNPYSIYWYATEEDTVILSEVIEYAIKHGYDIIIMEQLEPAE